MSTGSTRRCPGDGDLSIDLSAVSWADFAATATFVHCICRLLARSVSSHVATIRPKSGVKPTCQTAGPTRLTHLGHRTILELFAVHAGINAKWKRPSPTVQNNYETS